MIKFADQKFEAQFKRLPEAIRLVVRELSGFIDEQKWGDVVITCVLRDPDKNAAVGGAKQSLHLDGRAVDIRSRDYTQKAMESINAWLRARCPRKSWEIITEPHGTGPHIHIGWKRAQV